MAQTNNGVQELLFTRNQLIKDEHFLGYRDIICAIMPEDEKWSVKETNKKITAFLSRKIK